MIHKSIDFTLTAAVAFPEGDFIKNSDTWTWLPEEMATNNYIQRNYDKKSINPGKAILWDR